MAGSTRALRTAAALAVGAALLAAGPAGAVSSAISPPRLAPRVVASAAVAYDAAGTARLYALVNAHRVAIGLAPLRVHAGLVTMARGWTAHMATTQVLSHNDALFSRARHTALRIASFGENVAYSSVSVDGAHTVLMHSPHHLANIEQGSFAVSGFAVFTDTRGWYWVTEDFGSTPKSAVAVRSAAAPVVRRTVGRTVAAAPRAVVRAAARPVARTAAPPVAAAARLAVPRVPRPVASAYVDATSGGDVARTRGSAGGAAARLGTVRVASARDVPPGRTPLGWVAGALVAVVAGLLLAARRSATLAG